MTKKKPDNDALIRELVSLVRESHAQQAEVLKVALEGQKATAEVLSKWMGMFTPSPAPLKSTTEEEREQLRQELADAEWDPINVSLGDLMPKDLN